MHCPRCGQQQISEEIKFCSRCGFPLGLVSELILHGGFLPQLIDAPKNKKWLTRKNGIKFGLVWLLLITFLLLPLAAIAGAEEGAAFLAIVGFVGGLLMMLFSWMFLEAEAKNYAADFAPNANAAPQFFSRNQAQNALPASQSQPAQSYAAPANSWKAPDTGELARPGSVTEGTTKLLRNDE
jgi:hypothetical protein